MPTITPHMQQSVIPQQIFWLVYWGIADQTIQDIKYQDITYYCSNGKKHVKSRDRVHIDFFKAKSEMNDLDWNLENCFIGFDNHAKKENLQFLRTGANTWIADVPIRNPDWKGYYWGCETDTEQAIATTKLFFEEADWFGILPWVMNKYNPSRDHPRLVSDP